MDFFGEFQVRAIVENHLQQWDHYVATNGS